MREKANFIEDFNESRLYVDRISDTLRERLVLLGMDRVSAVKMAEPASKTLDEKIIKASDDGSIKPFTEEKAISVVLYTLTTEPREHVVVDQPIIDCWLRDFQTDGCNKPGRTVIPGIPLFAELNVWCVPEGLCPPHLKAASCYFIFPLTNGEIRAYRNEAISFREKANNGDTQHPKNQEKPESNITQERDSLKAQALKSLELTTNNPNKAFNNLVKHVMKYSVQTRITVPIHSLTEEEVIKKYRQAAKQLLDMIWDQIMNPCDDAEAGQASSVKTDEPSRGTPPA